MQTILFLFIYWFIGIVVASVWYLVNEVLRGKADDYWIINEDDLFVIYPLISIIYPLCCLVLFSQLFICWWKEFLDKAVCIIKKIIEE